jgi:hypothetical protein
MANFEQVGQKIDREIARLRKYLETEVKPVTKKRLAGALRSASARMAKMARELERRRAPRGARTGARRKTK